jgi:hypothetical protein
MGFPSDKVYPHGMNPPNSTSFPRSDEPKPELTPPPGDVPKRFPEKTPLSDDGVEAAKKESTESMRSASSGSGEDPFVESGLPENDPERPRETPEEQSME